jgi:hypothetical protein
MSGPRLLLDLSAVSFIDCAGLRAVMLTRRPAEPHGWPTHLIAASAMTRKMITLTGMEGVLPVRDQDGDSGTCASGEPEHREYYLIDPSWIQCTRRRSPRAVTYRDE